MEIKNTLVSRLLDSEVSAKRSALSKFGEKLWKFAKSKLSTRYGYKIEITDDYLIGVVNNFIKQYDKKFENRQLNENGLLCDTTVLINIDENTFLYCSAGNPLEVDTTTKLLIESNKSEGSRSISTRLKVFLYGKYAKKYLQLLKSKITRKNTGNLRIFNISANANSDKQGDSFSSVISDLIPRDISTLFYDGDIKEQVLAHIDGFFKTKDLYKEKNLNYKTSLLLYGEPGTGKSSLANALCAHYNIDMVLIDLNTFDKLDINMVTKCINGDDKTYLVLIEDIDTVFNVNRSQETLDKDDKKVVNKMLQFLDSNNSPNNVIFICTTNHIDKLDAAILRKGRIDKNIYVGPIDKTKAETMIRSFDLTEDSVDKLLSKYDDDARINQSTLQAEILDFVKLELQAKAGDIPDSDHISSNPIIDDKDEEFEDNATDEIASEEDEDNDINPDDVDDVEEEEEDDE